MVRHQLAGRAEYGDQPSSHEHRTAQAEGHTYPLSHLDTLPNPHSRRNVGVRQLRLPHMEAIGAFTFVLHSHLPYCRMAGRWPHGEEWLHEAAAETYIPLLSALTDLHEEGLPIHLIHPLYQLSPDDR